MKIKLRKASDIRFSKERTLKSLDDLKRLSEEFDSKIVINYKVGQKYKVDAVITVYDGYLE